MNHNYHILNFSSYPYLFFFSILILMTCMVMFLKYNFNFLILFVMMYLLFLMFIWFKDIIYESFCGYHNFYVQDGLKIGMIMFIFSEFMFFFSIFWLFFDSSLNPMMDIGSVWPPFYLYLLDPWGIPFLNTLILLSSGLTITMFHYFLLFNNWSKYMFLLTIVLAFIFLLLQLVEYFNMSFLIVDSIFGSVFFFATGFHGFHVMIGMIFFIINFFRFILNNFTFIHHLGLEFSIIYWHFVDVVWLFLFMFIYYWSY